ncbi:MAG: thioesterase family protein [Pikeienuella sp.]
MRDYSPSCAPRAFPPSMLRMSRQTVLPEWIDYNGHMNVAFYVMALDRAFDELLEDWIGIGESFVARSRLGPMSLQAQTFYIAEMVEGEAFHVDIQLIDYDAKRFHFYGEMIAENDGRLAAAYEGLSMAVDLEERRPAPYPDWAIERLAAMMEAQSALPIPERVGKPIKIRKK